MRSLHTELWSLLSIFLLTSCIVPPSTTTLDGSSLESSISSSSLTSSLPPSSSSIDSQTESSISSSQVSSTPTSTQVDPSSSEQLITYQVEFFSRGGSPVDPQVVHDQGFIVPVTSTLQGFTLAGWFLSSDDGLTFSEAWQFDRDRVTMPLQLYARWQLHPQFNQLASQASHGIALTESGHIIGWGNNQNQQIGEGEELVTPILLSSPTADSIVKISTGTSHSLLLTATGEVYAWGSNSHGQLALPNTVISQATMTKVIFPGDDDPEIVDIAAGHAHSLAVTSMGEVFTWGFNLYGQIGDGTQTTLGTNRNKYTPTKVTFDSLELDEKVINVFGSAGHSSFALTNQGRLFSWGRSAYGSLGLGAVPHQTRPQRIQFPGMEVDEHIDAVTIGGLHAFAQTSLKRWYAWGFNYAGQLGHGTYVDVNVPIRLDDSIFPWQTVRTMSAGSNFTLLVTEAEQVYSFGVNQSGQLGIGSFTNQAIPTAVLIDNLDVNDTVTTVTAAGLQSYVTTTQGRIFVWGDNPYPLMDEIAEGPFATPLELTNTLITYLGLF